MTVTVTHICNHNRELIVPGVCRAREMKRWMATVKCPSCREREALLAQPRLGPFTTEQLVAFLGAK